MASEQANTNEAIVQAVADVTRTAIQAMAVAGVERNKKRWELDYAVL